MSSFYDIPEIPEKERRFCFGTEIFFLSHVSWTTVTRDDTVDREV